MEVLSKAQGTDRLSLVSSLILSLFLPLNLGPARHRTSATFPFHAPHTVILNNWLLLADRFQHLTVCGTRLSRGTGGSGAAADWTASSAVSKQKWIQLAVSHAWCSPWYKRMCNAYDFHFPRNVCKIGSFRTATERCTWKSSSKQLHTTYLCEHIQILCPWALPQSQLPGAYALPSAKTLLFPLIDVVALFLPPWQLLKWFFSFSYVSLHTSAL